MASIYRFTRKSKQEDPNAKKAKSSEKEKEEFFPLLFGEELKNKEESATDTAPQNAPEAEEADLSQTREVSLSEEQKDSTPFFGETRAFDLFSDSKKNRDAGEKEVPDELLKALQETKVNEQKLDEVFHTKRSFTTSTSEEEFDETTALLREVFGTDSAKKKKKQKEAAPQSSPEDIESVFRENKTIEEALDAAVAARPEEERDDYVAIHDSAEEKTKEFSPSFSVAELEEKLGSIGPDETAPSVPELAEEVRISDQDNPYHDTYDELEEKHLHPTGLPEEFTSQEEYDEFAEHLRNRSYKNMCIGLWSCLAFLLLFYLESATFSNFYHPEFLKPGGIYNSVIYLLVDIQLVLIAGLITISSVGSGLKRLFSGKPNRHSLSAIFLLFALIHPLVLLISGIQEYPLFGSVAALFAFINSIANFMESKRIYRTFRVCGRRGDKLAATEITGESAEAEAFRDQLEGDPKFFSVQKTSFIDGFFQRVENEGKAGRSYGSTLLLSLCLSIAFAAFSYWKEPSWAIAVNRFMMMVSMTLPLSGVLTVVLPFAHLSKKAEKTECAVVCAADAEEYASADVVSFTDKEIFPAKNVKVTTIRTYGQTRIDKAILFAAMIFQKLGGPMSQVFKKTISGVYTEIPEEFDFLEITADGMCAKIEGKDVFVGNKNYLLSYDFGYTKDTMDEEFEAKFGKIMYMVIGSELAAKFYIRYAMSNRFKKTILSLFKCGICPAVKTCDPNIDADLFRALLKNEKIPAGIIKTCDAMKDAPAVEKSQSGLVCTSSIANLLGGFSICDSLHHLCVTNSAVKDLALGVGAAVVLFLYFIENLTKISGLFVLVYQLLWMIPVIIPSLSE